MKMNMKSWHSHIINQYTDSRADNIGNFCPYVRKVIRGIFNILGIMLAACGAIYLFVFGWIATAVAMYTHGFGGAANFIGDHYPQWMVGNIITLVLVVMICAFLFDEHVLSPIKEKRREAKYAREWEAREQKRAGTYVEPEHGLIVTWYKANHDKICPPLDW
jgi:uncharacterized membrane protein